MLVYDFYIGHLFRLACLPLVSVYRRPSGKGINGSQKLCYDCRTGAGGNMQSILCIYTYKHFMARSAMDWACVCGKNVDFP